jgi:CIC family chloride channel protein
MLFASVVVGVLTGFGAWCLKFLIQSVSAYTVVYAVPGHYSWVFAIAPAGALILVGAMQRHLFHRSINRGTEKIKGLLKKHDYVLPHQLAYQPVFACALTVGLGGSAGSEGPIAYSGGAIGSGVARMCRLPASMTRAMMVCGAAAGIAAIFKAPLGGFFFALEVIGVSLSAITLIALATCCMTASATACAFSGSLYDLSVAGAMPAFDWCHLPVILLLGGALGLYSL